MVILQEVCKRQLASGILFKALDTRYKSRAATIRSTDVIKDIIGSFLFELHIAPLRQRCEPILDLTRHAARCIGEQRSELVLEIVLSVRLTDEVENGQAILIFCKAQTASELL